MPSSYSTNLKIELQATGENSGTWGTITNTNLGTALEQAVVGYGNPSYASDANLTLTYTDTNAAQAARALVLNVTSAVSLTVTRELVVPTIQKQYIVQNNTTGSQSITVKTSGGTGITVTNGRKAHLYVNGTDVIFMDDFVDINGGTIDGTVIGGAAAAAGTFTTATATTGNITTVNATTVDTTNIEVTNLKAKDGTAAGSIADSTGVVTLASSVLTTTDINGGTIDGTTIGGSSAAAGSFSTLTTSSTVTLNGGTANGVAFLNASKVVTSGSVLTFDGTALSPDGTSRTLGTTALRWGTVHATALSDGTDQLVGSAGASARFGYGASWTSLAFAISGSEAMRLNATGLGIGTASPAVKLQVAGAIRSNSSVTGPLANLHTSATNPASTGASGNGLNFGYDSNGEICWIQANRNDITETRSLLLNPNGGNLGIGTTSPAAKLNVDAGSAGLMSVFDSTNANGGYLLGRSSGTAVWDLGTAKQALNVGGATDFGINVRSGFMAFGTNNAERLRLDSSGNLGLGVTPSAWVTYKCFQVGGSAALWGPASTGSEAYLNANSFYNGSNRIYISTNFATEYSQSSGVHAWKTAASGTAGNAITFTQAMTLDASGNLGIGTTTAPGSNGGGIAIFKSDYPRLTFRNTATGDGATDGTQFAAVGANFEVYNKENGNIEFGTNNTERCRITAAGDLVVNNTTALNGSAKLSVWNTAAGASGIATGYSTTFGQFRLIYLNNTADALSFDNGNNSATLTSGGTWTNASDARLKKNIQQIKYGLDTVLAAQPRSFNRVDVGGDYIGFIAQELQAQIPEVVYGNEDTKYSVDYGSLVAVAFRAIQEQQAIIAALTARLTALESK